MTAAPAQSKPTSRATFASGKERLAFYTRGLEREQSFEPLEVEGDLPTDLVGTIYRNGPGLAELHGRRYAHPFESDGAISAVRFDGSGKATGALRVIESEGLRAERDSGRVLFGSGASWPRRVWNNLRGRLKNTANTSVMVYQDKLYALMEAARPTEIDADNLSTIGESTLGGAVRGAFSAHPHRVDSRACSYNFGIKYGRHNAINIYELPDSGTPRRLTQVPIGFPPMLHDFIATESTLLFFLSPVSIRVLRLMSGLASFDELFAWQPERGTEVLAVPIDRPDEVKRFKVDAFYQWHFANAFDTGPGELSVDFVRYGNFDSFKGLASGRDFAPGVLHRARLDLGRESLAAEPLATLGCEFPRIHSRCEGGRHRYIWVMTDDDRGIARVDCESGQLDQAALDDGRLTSEPVFVARPGATEENDGYALALSFDLRAGRSFLAVFDAANLAAGPRARVWFEQQLPQTFHGVWLGSG